MSIKADTKEFEPKAKYTLQIVEGKHIENSMFKAIYDNDNFEEELELMLNAIRTTILSSKTLIDSLNN